MSSIYVINADGSGLRKLTLGRYDFGAVWSPVGERIAFTRGKYASEDLFVVNANGSGERRLTRNPTDDFDPVLSPDGKRIAFTNGWDFGGGGFEIYVVDADGGSQMNLTRDPAIDDMPAWSPDGAQIAFVSDRDGTRDIFVMDSYGSDQRRLIP
jgi:TolB protein